MKALLEAGAGTEAVAADGTTALMQAAFHGSVDCVEALLAAGASLTAVTPKDRYSALHYAVLTNRRAAAKRLVAAGAHLAARDYEGRTPRELAEERGSLGLARVLQEFERGAGARKGEVGMQHCVCPLIAHCRTACSSCTLHFGCALHTPCCPCSCSCCKEGPVASPTCARRQCYPALTSSGCSRR